MFGMVLNIDHVKAYYHGLLPMEHMLAASQKNTSEEVGWPFCIKPLPYKI